MSQNTWLEDLCAEIGYSATNKLAGWYGGRNLYVPAVASEDHLLAKLIGMSAFARLVAEHGPSTIPVPKIAQVAYHAQDRLIYTMLSQGRAIREVVDATGLSLRQVYNRRAALEDAGILPMISRSRGRKQPVDG